MEKQTNESIKALEDAYSVPSYAKWPVAFVEGRGATVLDADGNEYLDLYGGHCVTLIGHCHPHWVAAVSAQVARLGFYSNVAYNDERARFHKRLVAFAPDHIRAVFMCNSGSEANETAVKLAMKATGRTGVIAMQGGFHGRTAGALSLTHLGKYREQFPAVVRETRAAPFGDIDGLKAMLGPDTAAVILEPIQSMNSVQTADDDYYPALVDACHRNGTLVVFDEIQTGLGRLGAPFAAERFDAEADLITLAKGLGNGIPMAAVITTQAVSETVAVGEQGTTFGGGPIACAAGNAVLDVLEKENLVAQAKEIGAYIKETLIAGPVNGIRGEGLLVGLETSAPAKAVCRHLFKHRILAGTSADPHVARLMPPLTIGRPEVDRLRQALLEFRPE
jgi:acetylornithine/N-succinyldiaminopimelate aminotransferase